MIHTRECPNCHTAITYKYSCSLRRAEKENRVCINCKYSFYPGPNLGKKFSIETKKKMSASRKGKRAWNKGIPLSSEHSKNLSKSLKGRKVWSKGKKFSSEYRLKLSRSHKGQKSPMADKTHSEDTKYKLRLATINDLRKKGIHFGNKGASNFNPKACKYLDKLNEERGWNLQHAMNGGEIEIYGYFVDGFDKGRNIIVEYDEKDHNRSDRKLKDSLRQNNIISHLQTQGIIAEFWRYKEMSDRLERVF